jgi:flagella basal body P-ring formation protein FlgA
VVGLELQKAVPMGTRLTPKLFRLARMVKAGDALTVLVTSGDLTVIAQGIARTDGVMGQLIKVSNPESKVEFMARVVAPNRVSLDLEGSQ